MRLPLLLLALTACQLPDPAGPDTAPPAIAHGTGPSLYELPVHLVDAEGRETGLDAVRGHPAVLAMFYGSCGKACPMLVERIKAFQDALSAAEREELRIALVSFDGSRDSAAALRDYAARQELDAHWTLLSGDESAIRDVAAVLGAQYRRRPDGEFDHSTGFVVVDAEGRELARVDGLATPFDGAMSALRADGPP
jgi:protein SCO1/2